VNRHHLDARRLLCPLPVIRAQQAIAVLAPGDRLELACTDPGALYDVPAWCRVHGHRVVGTREDGHDIIIEIEVGPCS
jgi:tRNA 2-thiouridine synthesizing protein A